MEIVRLDNFLVQHVQAIFFVRARSRDVIDKCPM